MAGRPQWSGDFDGPPPWLRRMRTIERWNAKYDRGQPFDYDDHGIPVVGAQLGQCGACLSFFCPYCRRRHFHGLPEGHRAEHCSNPNMNAAKLYADLMTRGVTIAVRDGRLLN